MPTFPVFFCGGGGVAGRLPLYDKMKKITFLFPSLFLMALMLCLVSCSDNNEDTVDEFADWQTKNVTYWDNLYSATQDRIAKGDSTWKIIPSWAIEGLDPTHGEVKYSPMQYIVVHVLENGTGTDYAAFTDSVKVHYEGHLIPSATYTAGYRFDVSYSGTFNPVSSNPTILKINSLTDGFATAAMKMRAGDHWMVYVPFTLGYGSQEQSSASIPAYSDLIFDLRMVEVCR